MHILFNIRYPLMRYTMVYQVIDKKWVTSWTLSGLCPVHDVDPSWTGWTSFPSTVEGKEESRHFSTAP